MPHTVETELLADRQAKLTVTVDPSVVQRELKQAAKRIASKANIPGFRKGKAPYRIVVQYFGEGAIYNEALEVLGNHVYSEALEQSALEPIAPGDLTDLNLDPMVLTFTVPLRPAIDLGDYRSIRVSMESVTVDDDAVEQALSELQNKQATLEPVEKKLELGMVGRFDIKAYLIPDETTSVDKTEDGEDSNVPSDTAITDNPVLSETEVKVLIAENTTYPVPGFSDHVLDMSRGESRSFQIQVDDSAEDLFDEIRGKTLGFDVQLHETYTYELPERNDEFAQSVGDFETLEDLVADVHHQLERSLSQENRNEYLERMLAEMLKIAKLEYPPVLVEEEIDRRVKSFAESLERNGLNLESYLKQNNLTEDNIRTDFRDNADLQVKRNLLLGEIANCERIKISDAEIQEEMDKMFSVFGENAASFASLLNTPRLRTQVVASLLTTKTIDRLIAIGSGNAPDLESLDLNESPADPVESHEDQVGGEQSAVEQD